MTSQVENDEFAVAIDIASTTKIVYNNTVQTFENAWKGALQDSPGPISCYGMLKLTGPVNKDSITEKLTVTVVKSMQFSPKEPGSLKAHGIDHKSFGKMVVFTTIWGFKGQMFAPMGIALVTVKSFAVKAGDIVSLS